MDQLELLKDKFLRIGARLKIFEIPHHMRDSNNSFRLIRIGGGLRVINVPRDRNYGFRLDIRNDRKGEYFELLLFPVPGELFIVDFRPNERPLLLMAKFPREALESGADRRAKFLCGHDERHWFSAGVDPNARNVADAMQSLKPEHVNEKESRYGVKARNLHRRRNGARIRQGEWFFIPAPDLNVDPNRVRSPEPIVRGRGKAHMADEGYQLGGERVYVTRQFPNGLTESEYAEYLAENRDAKNWNWRVMTRDAEVYVRGRVRHPDHATVVLNGWHQVLPNEEVSYEIAGRSPMAFLD